MKRLLFLLLGVIALPVDAALTDAYQAWTATRPGSKFVAVFGDSIVAGVPNFDPGFPGWTPTGVNNGNVAYRIQLACTNAITATNYGVSGASVAFCDNVANTVLTARPKYAILRVGFNDLMNSRQWPDVVGSWNSIRAKCVASNAILVACSIWPSTALTPAAQSNYNTALKAWCTSTGTKFIETHDTMASVSNVNALNPLWTVDGIHPSTNGTVRDAELLLAGVAALEGTGGSGGAGSGSETGTEYVATGVTYAAVKAAYDRALHGDTVVIPAGTADWTTTFVVTKGVTIKGAGVGLTIIRTAVPDGSPLMDWHLVSNRVSRLTGIEFRKGNGPAANYVAAFKLNGVNTDGRRIRIDHCKFDTLECSVLLNYTALGVFDHNTVISSGTPAWLGYMKGNSWNGVQSDNTFGDGAWAAPDQFGTEQFFFMEDNIFTNKNEFRHVTLMDSQAGARYVFRNNKVYKGSLESHGLEASRERSGRAFEIYNNTFDGIGTQDFISYFRGGVALVYSNYVFGFSANPKLQLLNNRLKDPLAAPFGGADGRNPWDANDPANPIVTGTVSTAGALTIIDNGKSWSPDQWAGYILRRTSGKRVTSVTRNGATVTVNCPSHGFANGERVSLFGANEQPYNTIYIISTVNSDVFTVQNGWTPPSPATGTIYAARGNHFSEIAGNTASQITFFDSGYGTLTRMVFNAGDTYEINRIVRCMDMTGASMGPLLTGATPNVPPGGNGQGISPWYEWNNVNCSTGPARLGATGTDIDFATIPKRLVVENVHFFNDTVKPGYTAFTYPHPLATGGSVVIGTPPARPGGLRTVSNP
jgi:hypothetical protein